MQKRQNNTYTEEKKNRKKEKCNRKKTDEGKQNKLQYKRLFMYLCIF